MLIHPGVVVVLSCALTVAACCPTTSGPTGPLTTFGGTVHGGGLAFHDYPPPSRTTQMEVTVSWSDGEVDVRLFWVDPNCNPVLLANCTRYAEPIPPRPGAGLTISVTATNQGPAANPIMRFVIENRTRGRGANYSITIAPRQAGCT